MKIRTIFVASLLNDANDGGNSVVPHIGACSLGHRSYGLCFRGRAAPHLVANLHCDWYPTDASDWNFRHAYARWTCARVWPATRTSTRQGRHPVSTHCCTQSAISSQPRCERQGDRNGGY